MNVLMYNSENTYTSNICSSVCTCEITTINVAIMSFLLQKQNKNYNQLNECDKNQ